MRSPADGECANLCYASDSQKFGKAKKPGLGLPYRKQYFKRSKLHICPTPIVDMVEGKDARSEQFHCQLTG